MRTQVVGCGKGEKIYHYCTALIWLRQKVNVSNWDRSVADASTPTLHLKILKRVFINFPVLNNDDEVAIVVLQRQSGLALAAAALPVSSARLASRVLR